MPVNVIKSSAVPVPRRGTNITATQEFQDVTKAIQKGLSEGEALEVEMPHAKQTTMLSFVRRLKEWLGANKKYKVDVILRKDAERKIQKAYVMGRFSRIS